MSRHRQWILVALALLAGFALGTVACEDTPPTGADSRVSDFLRVGQSYRAWASDGDYYSFTVSQIVNDSWIVASTGYGSGWLNVSQLVFVRDN